MTKKYIVELSEAEDKALHHIAVDGQQWIENFAKERCRLAIEEIVQSEVQRLLALGETISGSKEDIVMAAPISSAKERAEEKQKRMEEQFRNGA